MANSISVPVGERLTMAEGNGAPAVVSGAAAEVGAVDGAAVVAADELSLPHAAPVISSAVSAAMDVKRCIGKSSVVEDK
jgi:hypothetical protein